MVAMKAKQATKAVKAAKKAINIPMNDITKAIAEQTQLKRYRVQAVFDALAEIAKANVQKTDKFAIPDLVLFKLVEAKAGKRMMFAKHLGVTAQPTMKATKAMKAAQPTMKATTAATITEISKAAKAAKATKKFMTITEISDMYNDAAMKAAEAAGVLMAAAQMGSAQCA